MTNQSWIMVQSQQDLDLLREKLHEDSEIVEIYCHEPIVDEIPPGASASGYKSLITRLLISLGNSSYVEIVFDFTEEFASHLSSKYSPSLNGSIDGLGRFKGSFFSKSEDIVAGRLRYRYLQLNETQREFYFFKSHFSLNELQDD